MGSKTKRICPLCGNEYTDEPAISRVDNETLICPDCGVRESLESIGGIPQKDIEHIVQTVRSKRDEARTYSSLIKQEK